MRRMWRRLWLRLRDWLKHPLENLGTMERPVDVKPGKLYYYYGRIVRTRKPMQDEAGLVAKSKEAYRAERQALMDKINSLADSGMDEATIAVTSRQMLENLNEMQFCHCRICDLQRSGLPCPTLKRRWKDGDGNMATICAIATWEIV